MQPGSHSSPIQLTNLKDHTTYSEGQHPINIMLNKTSFHAEKTAHQQTHGPHTSTAWLTVKAHSSRNRERLDLYPELCADHIHWHFGKEESTEPAQG